MGLDYNTRFGAKLSGIGYVESTQTGAPPDSYKKSIESKPYHGATALLQRRFDALVATFPRCDFKGKTIIRRGLSCSITVHYGSLPMFFVLFLFNFEVWG